MSSASRSAVRDRSDLASVDLDALGSVNYVTPVKKSGATPSMPSLALEDKDAGKKGNGQGSWHGN
jgi:hypothetical protein